jgi:hypothetical protein
MKPAHAMTIRADSFRPDSSRPGTASRNAAARTIKLNPISSADTLQDDHGASFTCACQCQNAGMPAISIKPSGSSANARRDGLASGRIGLKSRLTIESRAVGTCV